LFLYNEQKNCMKELYKKNAQQGTALLQFQATNEKTYPLYNIQIKESSPSTGFMPVSST
jgi:hypothetical protein